MSTFTPNDGQRAAIEAPVDQPVRVVAGAGTGKTEVIARRFLRLLETTPGLQPAEILVLTFTEKAAAEMRARIFSAVTASGRAARPALASTYISTFHAFGVQLLRDHSLAAGIDAELPLLNEVDAQEIEDAAKEQFLAEGYEHAYAGFDPLSTDAYDWTGVGPFAHALAVVAQLRNQAVAPDQFAQSSNRSPEPSDRRRVLAPLAHWLYAAYRDHLLEKGLLDFDRIIGEAAWLLEHDVETHRRVRAQFRMILVDEFQDTNHSQSLLLRALAANGLVNVTVVGDPRQAIYVWREARVENIANFPRVSNEPAENPGITMPLTENRRSLTPILTVANHAIAGYAFGARPEFDAHSELAASADHVKFTGTVVSLYAAEDRESEAQAIAAWIAEQHDAGRDYRDIAILLRALTFRTVYTDALSAAGIPFELSAGDEFYARGEILDAIHLLNVCLDPSAELSLARVLLSPATGMSQSELASLKRQSHQPLWELVTRQEAGVSASVRARLDRLVELWREAQREMWLRSPAAFAGWAIHRAGLDTSAELEGLRALRKLQAIAHDYEAAHPAASARDLTDYLRRVLDGDQRAKAPELSGGEDAVRVLTAHASKGLEFPVVVAADSRQKITPNRDFQPFHEPDEGLICPADDEDDPRFVERMRRMRNEARCLWYVTLTRAKERLIITATNAVERADDGSYANPRTFFEELWNKQLAAPAMGVSAEYQPPASPTAIASSAQQPSTQVKGRVAAGGSSQDSRTAVGTARSRVPAEGSPLMAEALALRATLYKRLHAKPELHATPSGFRIYQQCPAAYRFYNMTRFERLEAVDEIDGDSGDGPSSAPPERAPHARPEADQGAGRLGAAFHALAAAHTRRPSAPAEQLLKESAPGLNASLQATLRGWFGSYLQGELGSTPPPPEAAEHPLHVTLETTTAHLQFNGIADRLEPARLVDYKTDAQLDGLAARHGDQVRLYALAARAAGLLNADAVLTLYHAPTASLVPVPFADSDEAHVRQELEAFASALSRPDAILAPRAGPYCRWCAARELFCKDGQEWMAAKNLS